MSSCHAVFGLWWAGLQGREKNQKRGKRGEGGDLGLGGSLHAAPPPLHDSTLCKQGVSSLCNAREWISAMAISACTPASRQQNAQPAILIS
eukprot:2044783-Rhodomonas_salina.1